MARRGLTRLRLWLLEVEMGAVWAVAGLSIILFMFASIWFIDPALLTLVLQFREARCRTEAAAVLVGISNCSWTSCRVGCTRDVYKCWQVQVRYDFVEGTGKKKKMFLAQTACKSVKFASSQYVNSTNNFSAKMYRLNMLPQNRTLRPGTLCPGWSCRGSNPRRIRAWRSCTRT